MSEIPRTAPPPAPASVPVTTRPRSKEGGSGSVVLPEEVRIRVCDVMTGSAVSHGAFLKYVEIKSESGKNARFEFGDETTYEHLPYPPKRRHRARFYKNASAALVRLGEYPNVEEKYTKSLGVKLLSWLNAEMGDKAPAKGGNSYFKTMMEALPEYLAAAEKRAGSPGRADDTGLIRIRLPLIPKSEKLSFKLEFQDIKVLPQEDVDSLMGGGAKDVSPMIIPHLNLVHDAQSASQSNSNKSLNPDVLGNEASCEYSGWALQNARPGVPKPDQKQFRNFLEFDREAEARKTTKVVTTVYALTWCPPAFSPGPVYTRSSIHTPPSEEIKAAAPAISTSLSASGPNYGVFGCFRRGRGYYRLHTGVDVAGNSRGQPTEVFAVNGGKVVVVGVSAGKITLFHRSIDEDQKLFTRYMHLQNGNKLDDGSAGRKLSLESKNRSDWVKAGTSLGYVGRVRSGASFWPDSSPSHVHFETMTRKATGWVGSGTGRFKELKSSVQKRLHKLIDSGVIPVHKNFDRKKNVYWQYSPNAGDPGKRLKEWVDRQIPGGSANYGPLLPASVEGPFLLPCQGEYGEKSKKISSCRANCRAKGEQAGDQIAVSGSCWAIRTSKDPKKAACPYFKQSHQTKFTDVQLVQYYLWCLGRLEGTFNGVLDQRTLRAVRAFCETTKKTVAQLDSSFDKPIADEKKKSRTGKRKRTLTTATAFNNVLRNKKTRSSLQQAVVGHMPNLLKELRSAANIKV